MLVLERKYKIMAESSKVTPNYSCTGEEFTYRPSYTGGGNDNLTLKSVYDKLKYVANEDMTEFIPEGGTEKDLYKSLDSLKDLICKLSDERNHPKNRCPENDYTKDFKFTKNTSLSDINDKINTSYIVPLVYPLYDEDKSFLLKNTWRDYCDNDAINTTQLSITLCECNVKAASSTYCSCGANTNSCSCNYVNNGINYDNTTIFKNYLDFSPYGFDYTREILDNLSRSKYYSYNATTTSYTTTYVTVYGYARNCVCHSSISKFFSDNISNPVITTLYDYYLDSTKIFRYTLEYPEVTYKSNYITHATWMMWGDYSIGYTISSHNINYLGYFYGTGSIVGYCMKNVNGGGGPSAIY
jgi:hypothetical protein